MIVGGGSLRQQLGLPTRDLLLGDYRPDFACCTHILAGQHVCEYYYLLVYSSYPTLPYRAYPTYLPILAIPRFDLTASIPSLSVFLRGRG